jgi:tetratricopeptide (TPR) repeat protein
MQNNRLEKLEQMLVEKPNDIFLNYALAIEYKALGKINETKLQFEKVLQFDENHVATLYQLGVLFNENGKSEDGIKFLEKAYLLAKNRNDHKTANECKALIDEILF